MKRYDLDGYLAVLRFRGCKTILVEGTTDQCAIRSAVRAFERERRLHPDSVVVDSVEPIEVSGLCRGSRELVERVYAAAREAGYEVVALTDREFRDFTVSAATLRDDLRKHRTPDGRLVWTRGHSIENYFFEPTYVQEYLHSRFAGQVSTETIDAIPGFWADIVNGAAALSLAAHETGLLRRLSGVFGPEAWRVEGARVVLLSESLEAAAVARGVAPEKSAAFRKAFETVLPIVQSCEDHECARWIAHGHLGDELVWLAVGQIAMKRGAPRNVVDKIAVGYRDDKHFHRSDRWAALHRTDPSVRTPGPLWRALGMEFGSECESSKEHAP